MATNNILTYFGLLPNEVLISHVKPYLSATSLVVLRNAYLATDIPESLDIFCDIFSEDSVDLLEYIGEHIVTTRFKNNIDNYTMLKAISLIRSTSMADMVMNVFDDYFTKFYFRRRINTETIAKRYPNRVLFESFFDNHQSIEQHILLSIKDSEYDPLLLHLVPDFLLRRIAEGVSVDPDILRILREIALDTQSLDLVEKLQLYDSNITQDIVCHALMKGHHQFAHKLKILLKVNDEEWYKICLSCHAFECLPINALSQSQFEPLELFSAYCRCENFDAMEQLLPHITDISPLNSCLNVAVMKWLYSRGIYPSFDKMIVTKDTTADDMRYLLSLRPAGVRGHLVWKRLARDNRYDLLLVLREFSGPQSFDKLVLTLQTYNPGICEMFYDMGCRRFTVLQRLCRQSIINGALIDNWGILYRLSIEQHLP